MTATPFVALLEVQDLDTAIDRHVHRLDHLPEAQVVMDLMAEAADLSQRRAAIAAERDGVAGRQQVLEDQLATIETRSRVVSARLYGGTVSAARDLQAMAADIEGLKLRASDFEDRALEVLEEREPLDAAVDSLDVALAGVAERTASAEVARDRAAAGLRADLEELRRQRDEAARVVAPELLSDYQQIRYRNGGVGAARLVGSLCGGCHLTLPAVELDRARRAPPDAVVHCEECGRILVRP